MPPGKAMGTVDRRPKAKNLPARSAAWVSRWPSWRASRCSGAASQAFSAIWRPDRSSGTFTPGGISSRRKERFWPASSRAIPAATAPHTRRESSTATPSAGSLTLATATTSWASIPAAPAMPARRLARIPSGQRSRSTTIPPTRPRQSCASAPGSSYFLLLFLQPFILIGLGLLGLCVCLAAFRGGFARFLRAAYPPLANPLVGGDEGSAPRRRDPVPAKRPGPAGTFRGELWAGVLLRGIRRWIPLSWVFGPESRGDRAAFLAAAATGCVALVRKIIVSLSGGSRVVIDAQTHTLGVYSRRRRVETPISQIERLRLRDVSYPGSMRVSSPSRGSTGDSGQRIRYLLLEAVTADGDIPCTPSIGRAFGRTGRQPSDSRFKTNSRP